MSAFKPSNLRRCVQAVLHTFGFVVSGPAVSTGAAQSFADLAYAAAMPITAEFASVHQLALALTPMPEIAVVPSVSQVSLVSYRPLAAQLAVTAAFNVRAGRKRRSLPAIPTQSRSAGTSVRQPLQAHKAKPVLKVSKKKRAAKRRHVWLSTQTRVVRPVACNVVVMARLPRNIARPSQQKGPARLLRLAA